MRHIKAKYCAVIAVIVIVGLILLLASPVGEDVAYGIGRLIGKIVGVVR